MRYFDVSILLAERVANVRASDLTCDPCVEGEK